MISGRRIN